MKLIAAAALLLLASPLFARDAATEERLNRLQAAVETLQAGNVELQKRLAELTRELREVREQSVAPAGNFADAGDVKELADRLREVDRKRVDDRDLILKEIERLGRTLGGGGRPRAATEAPRAETRPAGPQRVFEYTIQKGDTLSAIVAAYREQGVQVTVEQVLRANPGLRAEALPVGRTIDIPAP